MMATDEDALLCDMAETYRIYDLRAVPVSTLATLAFGLRPSSRSKMALAGIKTDINTLLLAIVADRVGTLVWHNTRDGMEGRNPPESLVGMMLGENGSRAPVEAYDRGEDFRAAWESITGG